MNIYIVIDPQNRITAHTSRAAAANIAGINPRTLKRNGETYTKRGFRIEWIELWRIKGRENNSKGKARFSSEY